MKTVSMKNIQTHKNKRKAHSQRAQQCHLVVWKFKKQNETLHVNC